MTPSAVQLDAGLWLLDLEFQRTPGTVAAYLLTGSHGHTLIETGPGSTLAALESAVAATGARFDEIAQLVVTHIHLDHAGAAGWLLRRLPHARLYVHRAGAAHMVDPSKLLASATRIYGDRMAALWGAFEPCPAARVTVLDDGAELMCGTRLLKALHTPGHASHHIAYHDQERNTLFTGDIGGVRLQGASYVRPPTPPPDLDVEAWHASVERIRATRPRALDLTHFGRFTDPGRHLDELIRRLDGLVAWTSTQLSLGITSDLMISALEKTANAEVAAEKLRDPSLAAAYELATPSGMTVNGLVRYLTRRPKVV